MPMKSFGIVLLFLCSAWWLLDPMADDDVIGHRLDDLAAIHRSLVGGTYL